MKGTLYSALAACTIISLPACVGGGSGGGASVIAGGEPDAACTTAGANGCTAKNGVYLRVVCDGASMKWQLVETCAAGATCNAVPNSNPMLTQCSAGRTAGSDATAGGDVTTASDTPTGGDATTASDTATGGDISTAGDTATGGDTATAGDTVTTGDTVTADVPKPVCGDGKCEAGEFNSTCPADCKAACQPACDGKQCGANGCGGVCGVCGETKACTDAGKCVAVATTCGDGECEPGENPTNCAKDCKPTCTANCAGKPCGDIDGCGGLCSGPCPGGGTCTADKNCQGGSLCGNGTCDPGETNANCATDCKPDCTPACGGKSCGPNGCGGSCGLCGTGKACTDEGQCVALGPVCGNGMCEAGESNASCPADCKPTGPVCGNGMCETGETNANCPADCKPTGPVCGNGTCEAGETSASCAADCKTTGGSCVGKCGGQSNGCYCDDLCSNNNDCCADYQTICKGSTCTPKCVANAVCGAPDGCGGKCSGTCTAGLVCNASKVCAPNSAKCGNGICETGESTTSCPSDCKTAGGSCSGMCGKQSGSCYCDTGCKQSNDCCADYDKFCGSTTTTCPNGKCEPGETEASCPADCKTCAGNWTLGSTFFKSGDTAQTGVACSPDGAPKNCPDGYWITFLDTKECICLLSCAAIGVTVGQPCTKDGAWTCQNIKATNASGNSGKMCVPVKWGMCTQ